MKKITSIFLLAIVFLVFGSLVWAISWEDDLAHAFKKARNEGKMVMADFYTDWCGWCKKLDKDVYTNTEVKRLAENFICAKINCQIDKGAFSKYGLKGYPTIIFFNANGDIIETVIGYKAPKIFVGIMKKVLDKISDMPADSQGADNIPDIKNNDEFKLMGIMYPKAVVNNRIVSAGDEIDGAKVIEITQNRVKLRYGDKELTLNIQSK